MILSWIYLGKNGGIDFLGRPTPFYAIKNRPEEIDETVSALCARGYKVLESIVYAVSAEPSTICRYCSEYEPSCVLICRLLDLTYPMMLCPNADMKEGKRIRYPQ